MEARRMKHCSKFPGPFAVITFLAFAASVSAANSIPAGTILPVSLNSTVSSAKCHRGQTVTARVMQYVPLADGTVIRAGAKVVGHVVDVTPAAGGSSATLTMKFDALESRQGRVLIRTNLRAIASFMAVDEAQIPTEGPDRGTPDTAWITEQVGGDTVYRGGGPVEGVSGKVGVPVAGGVLSHLTANADRGCRAEVEANDALQALWVFSSDACGVYGMSNLQIRHAGRESGEIVLGSAKGKLVVPRGTGMLLRVSSVSAGSINA
jgi:hypothetical protein